MTVVASGPIALSDRLAAADVRVGIVSYRTPDLLDGCLAALPDALGALAAEIVVVDNASGDGSVEVADRSGVIVIESDVNVGYARAMNQALAATNAPVLLALNPDTVPAPGSLELLVRTLLADPSVGLVVPQLRNLDGTVQHSVHRFPSLATAAVTGFVPPPLRRRGIGERFWLEGYSRFDRRTDIDWAVGAVHAIRREALPDAWRTYRERWFMYTEDLDLCWTLRHRGWRVVLEPDAVVTHVGNAAGAAAWGDGRDARWVEGVYDWYVDSRGRANARVWAAAQVAGLTAKLPVLRRTDPPLARNRAELRRLHMVKLKDPCQTLAAPPAPDWPTLQKCCRVMAERLGTDVVVVDIDGADVVPDDGVVLVVERATGEDSSLAARLTATGRTPEFSGRWCGATVAVVRQPVQRPVPPVPEGFRVLAVMPSYNEADIMASTLDYLAAEGVDVHVIDNWSTDGTFEIAAGRIGAGVAAVERFPAGGPTDRYDFTGILSRVETIANGDADWYVLHDVDERRSPPWRALTLREALWRVQCDGYNAVDHTILEFHPVDDDFTPGDDLEAHLQHWAPTEIGHNRLQRKAWRGGMAVALVASGGHDVAFEGRRLHPYNFLLKHYPIRSQRHGESKVLRDRKPRFRADERRRRWHEHYAHVRPGHQFVRRPDELERFDDSFWQDHLIERLTGTGFASEAGDASEHDRALQLAIRAIDAAGLGPPLRALRRSYWIARGRRAETGRR